MTEVKDRAFPGIWWIAFLAVPVLVALLLLWPVGSRSVPVVKLPDGTEFELAMVAFTNSYSYNQFSGPAWMLRFSKFIPDAIENRFLTRGGGISMGASSETNLMVVIEARNASGTAAAVTWLRIGDEDGNRYEGNSANGVLSSGGNRAVVWRVSAFPRRTRRLFLEGLVMMADGNWTNVGPFAIKNPLYEEDFPIWQPVPLPQSATNASLIATLEQLQSGLESHHDHNPVSGDPANPRSTRLRFSFRERNQPADQYRLHKLTISDATGNRWSPYLNRLQRGGPAWTTNGVAQFVGALWPGEAAWKIELQALRGADFATEEGWSVPPISLPNPATHDDLTNRFQLGDVSIQVANILAPAVEVTNSWRWIVRYWGQEDSVYGLGVKFDGEMGDRRLVVVDARDQAGNEFKLVEHRGADYPEQALFFQAPSGATELRLKLAFPELKEFEFIARPEFVNATNAARTSP